MYNCQINSDFKMSNDAYPLDMAIQSQVFSTCKLPYELLVLIHRIHIGSDRINRLKASEKCSRFGDLPWY
jgi:hypothetical protein